MFSQEHGQSTSINYEVVLGSDSCHLDAQRRTFIDVGSVGFQELLCSFVVSDQTFSEYWFIICFEYFYRKLVVVVDFS